MRLVLASTPAVRAIRRTAFTFTQKPERKY